MRNRFLLNDGMNQLTNVVDAIGTTKFGYNDGGQLTSEDGPWADDTVSYSYSARQRTNLSLAHPNASAWTQDYGHDQFNRLSNVVSAAGNFVYTYWNVGTSDRVQYLTLPGQNQSIENEFDMLARLTSTTLKKSSTVLNQHGYSMNEANQRTKQTFNEGYSVGGGASSHFTDYTYDDIGQLKTAQGKDRVWDNAVLDPISGLPGTYVETPRQHEQFGYAYDAAWNLERRTNNALTQTFSVDNKNQLAGAARSGTLTVAGLATGPKADLVYGPLNGVTNVVVSGTGLTTGNADLYADGAWAKTNATLANGNNTYTATAQDTYNRTATDSLTVNVPATTTFQYDGNGNLTNDGRRVFEYDYENQLTNVYVASAWKSEFKYDSFGRRRTRKEYGWTGSAWLLTNEVRYVYDGMLVVQERDANNLPQVSYTRGSDLSGSLQEAGGIGGLLARTDMPSTLDARLSTKAHAYYHADGNGNVTALVNTNGIVVARYNYDPYGNLLGMNGPLAEANTYRFSSKEWLANAALYYYGYRCYEPNLQRWLNRDPIADLGFALISSSSMISGWKDQPIEYESTDRGNIYHFVHNGPIYMVDRFGLDVWVMKDCSGLIKHRILVGKNADGTYWSTQFNPNAKSMIGKLACMGTATFTEKELTINPEKTDKDSDYCIERHVPASQKATNATKAEARAETERDHCGGCGKNKVYSPGTYDCRDWANSWANYAATHDEQCKICNPSLDSDRLNRNKPKMPSK